MLHNISCLPHTHTFYPQLLLQIILQQTCWPCKTWNLSLPCITLHNAMPVYHCDIPNSVHLMYPHFSLSLQSTLLSSQLYPAHPCTLIPALFSPSLHSHPSSIQPIPALSSQLCPAHPCTLIPAHPYTLIPALSSHPCTLIPALSSPFLHSHPTPSPVLSSPSLQSTLHHPNPVYKHTHTHMHTQLHACTHGPRILPDLLEVWSGTFSTLILC